MIIQSLEVRSEAEAPCVIYVEKNRFFRVWEGVEMSATAGRQGRWLERIKRNPPVQNTALP